MYFKLATEKESYDTIDYRGVVKFTSGWSKIQCHSIGTILEVTRALVTRASTGAECCTVIFREQIAYCAKNGNLHEYNARNKLMIRNFGF